MSNRHLARTLAVQTLYQWDFLGKRADDLKNARDFVREEFAPKFDDHEYVESTTDGVVERIDEIDALLATNAPYWSIDQMNLIDRNVLRVAVYEIVFNETIPSKVAINEAIEIAKTFGGDTSGKFVNGVLGALYKARLAEGKTKKIDEEKEGVKQELKD